MQTYSPNKVVLKVISQWYCFLRKWHAKIMQTASPIDAFVVTMTRGMQTANPIGAFAAAVTRDMSPLPLVTQPVVVNPLV